MIHDDVAARRPAPILQRHPVAPKEFVVMVSRRISGIERSRGDRGV